MRTLRSVPAGMVTVLGTRGGGAGVESTAREESGGGGMDKVVCGGPPTCAVVEVVDWGAELGDEVSGACDRRVGLSWSRRRGRGSYCEEELVARDGRRSVVQMRVRDCSWGPRRGGLRGPEPAQARSPPGSRRALRL